MVDITNNLSQVGSSIPNNFNKYIYIYIYIHVYFYFLKFSSARSFVNYFVPNMNRRYGMMGLKGNTIEHDHIVTWENWSLSLSYLFNNLFKWTR
jgi:hypothetical protein